MNSVKPKQQKTQPKQTSRNLIFIVAPLLIFAFILVLYLFFRTSSITGKILTSSDNKTALSGVKIDIDGKTYYNNSDSTYTLTGLSSGQHNITFQKEGYKDSANTVNLEKGQNLDFNVYLQEIIKNNHTNTYEFLALGSESKNLINSLSTENYNNDYIKKNIIVLDKSKIYTSDTVNTFISVLDYNTGKELNKIQMPSGLRPGKITISNLRDKLFTVLSDNTIGIINLSDNSIKQTQVLDSRINNLYINQSNNSGFIVHDNKISLFNPLSLLIKDILNINNFSPSSVVFNKNYLFILNPRYQEIIKLDGSNILNKQDRIKLDFIPDKMVITRSGKIYISSGTSLNIINSETNEVIKPGIDTGINILNMKISPTDDNIYITNNSPNVYIFDTGKNELLKDNITLKEPVQDIFFSE